MPTVAEILDEQSLVQAFELMDKLIQAEDERNADAIVALKEFISRKFVEMSS